MTKKTVLEVIQATTAFFEKNGVESARLNIEHLLAYVLKKKRRVDLYLEFERELNEAELKPLRELVRRRARGEPLQHLLGTVEFHGREFRCDGRALVPRPETEHLVELILQNLLPMAKAPKPRWAELAAAAAAREEAAANEADGGSVQAEAATLLTPTVDVVSKKIEPSAAMSSPLPADARVLDVGTGSGVIALTLAAERPALRVAAVEVSREALALARENAAALGLAERVEFARGDLFRGAPAGPFDLVVANLPYVPAGEIAGLSPEVREFDPRLALDGGADGLALVARLIAEAPAHAPAGGELHLALEIGHEQAAEVGNLLIESGYEDVRTERDFQGVARFVFAKIRGG